MADLQAALTGKGPRKMHISEGMRSWLDISADTQGSLELPGIDGGAEENKGEVVEHHAEGNDVSTPDADVEEQGSSAEAHASAPSTQLGGATELVEPPRRATSKGSNATQLGGATALKGDPGARSGTRQRPRRRVMLRGIAADGRWASEPQCRTMNSVPVTAS